MRRTAKRWLVASAGAVAVAAGAMMLGSAQAVVDTVRPTAAMAAPAGDPCVEGTAPEALSQAFRCASARALPSVVHVKVESRRTVRSPFELFRDSPFGDLFPDMRIPPQDQLVR